MLNPVNAAALLACVTVVAVAAPAWGQREPLRPAGEPRAWEPLPPHPVPRGISMVEVPWSPQAAATPGAKVRTRPRESLVLAGFITFGAAYVASLGLGVWELFRPAETPLGSGLRRLAGLLAMPYLVVPVVGPALIGILLLPTGSPAAPAMLAGVLVQGIGLLIALAGQGVWPERTVLVPAESVPAPAPVCFRVLPGAPGAVLGASLAIDFP